MPNDQMYSRTTARPQGTVSRSKAYGPIIEPGGREILAEGLGPQAGGFRFDFGNATANPFANLTREQRMAAARCAGAKLPGCRFHRARHNIRYGNRRPGSELNSR